MIETSMNRLSAWDESLAALTANIRTKVRELKRDGVTGMGRANLRQIVSTRGVNVPNANAFERLLDQAIERADAQGFIY